MKVRRNTLLAIACLVWCFAGLNVFRIGISLYAPYVSIINLLLTVIVYVLFHSFVFSKLVNKHTTRILSYVQKKILFLKFFDLKSFFIMAIMIIGSIAVRVSGVVSYRFIAVFYTGLGVSLIEAGLLFGLNYIKSINCHEVNKLCK